MTISTLCLGIGRSGRMPRRGLILILRGRRTSFCLRTSLMGTTLWTRRAWNIRRWWSLHRFRSCRGIGPARRTPRLGPSKRTRTLWLLRRRWRPRRRTRPGRARVSWSTVTRSRTRRRSLRRRCWSLSHRRSRRSAMKRGKSWRRRRSCGRRNARRSHRPLGRPFRRLSRRRRWEGVVRMRLW
uniref:(northern house mosquito) hypothetical protein n=1 Tax=Culex pipiens TaxID=7175 RepID=A0A8D8FTX1_CULPI